MVEYIPGLEGVPAARSRICHIDGEQGILEYQGYPIEELAAHSDFIETSYLLLTGELPSTRDLEAFRNEVLHHRRLKFRLVDFLKALPEGGHPMDSLQAAVAALGMFYPRTSVHDTDLSRHSVVRLIAKLPTLVATIHRIRQGDEPLQPRDDLSHSSNFLYMMTEEVPDPVVERIFDQTLILHAEHSMNASTFCARVTASTEADAYTVVSSAIGALTGPLHGGANEAVVRMLEEVGGPDRVRGYLEKRLAAKKKVPGFGHRVYRVKDPRALILQKLEEQLSRHLGENTLAQVAREVERVMNERVATKGVYANVDFFSGLIYRQIGIPTDLFTPLFAIARVSGWLAHWLEQLEDNRIFRPDQVYTGKHGKPYIRPEQRGPPGPVPLFRVPAAHGKEH
ncbi:MAG: citrate synthase [Euryarchaeota archaeon]|nr:citrate synthase [Euryarchaeota archaeon]